MPEIIDTKLTTTTSSGNRIKVSAKLEYANGRIYFLKSPYSLKDEIKAMRGSRWHGYDDENPRKIWSVDDCQRNRFQLAYLQGEDVYEWFDRPLIQHEYERPLMPQQCFMADGGLTYHYQIWGAEMGCVDGQATVHVNRAGRGFQCTLADLFHKFHGGQTRGRAWDQSIPTYIRSLCDKILRLNRVVDVLSKGRKPVVKLVLQSGKSVRLTPDHEVCVGYGSFCRAEELAVDDTVLTNGTGRDRVDFVPSFDTVVSIEPDGEADVYDVVCGDPHRTFVANGIVLHNCGKTLSAQEVIERSGTLDWFWVGPKTSIPNIKREFRKWGFDFDASNIQFFTYEGLVAYMDAWKPGDPIPQGLICDESSRCKTATAQRTKAVQALADLIREKWGLGGYVILMSGTPSPKSPVDWWAQCEIVWPGWLREGSPKAMEQRLAFLANKQYAEGVFKKNIGWRDDEHKCLQCGQSELEGPHDPETTEDVDALHPFARSVNEVAYLYERLKGLATIIHKKDCLNLPEKRYRKVYCKPSASTLRVALALAQSAQNTVTGLTLLRELSDGFQYREVAEGTVKCPHCKDGTVEEWVDPNDEDRVFTQTDLLDPETVAQLEKRTVPCPRCNGRQEVPKIVRVTREVPCPKEAALRGLLDENEETGRVVIFAGFTGSVDRVVNICRREGWSVVRCDGRGFQVTTSDGTPITDKEPLDYWADLEANPRVAFVAHPESGGMSLTLTEARMAIYWSNSWKPEYRVQSEDRIHRLGMDENRGATIVDLIHLPSDERVLEVIQENRRIELMTMGEIMQDVNWQAAALEVAA